MWSFTDFAKRFVGAFPSGDLRRIAVIGGGDSGKVAVEALLGIGPSMHMSVPMLDWIEQIDWYAPALPADCDDWRQNERGRYQRIGSFLQQPNNAPARLRIFQQEGYVGPGLDKVYVGGRPYDAAIVCVGFERTTLEGLYGAGIENYVFGPDDVTRLARRYYDDELYQVGPRAELPFDNGDPRTTQRISNNAVALFRTLPRTLQLAMRVRPINPTAVPVPEAKTPRRRRKIVVGTGRDDVSLLIGDVVAYRTSFGRREYTGVLVASGRSDFLAIKRDDGRTGGGPDETWLVPTEVAEYLELTQARMTDRYNDPAWRLGTDRDGEAIYEGDRVRYDDEDIADYIDGAATASDGDYPIAVIRDDRTARRWAQHSMAAQRYDSLRKLY